MTIAAARVTVHPESDEALLADVAAIINQAGCDTFPGQVMKRWSVTRNQAISILEILEHRGSIAIVGTFPGSDRSPHSYGPARRKSDSQDRAR